MTVNFSINSTIPEVFFQRVKDYSNNKAVSFKEKRIWKSLTYKELSEKVLHLTQALISRGVKKGDRISILSENRYEYYITELAAMACGACAVPLYLNSPPSQIQFILDHCEPSFLFSTESQEALQKLAAINKKLKKSPKVVFFKEIPGKNALTFNTLLLEGRAKDLSENFMQRMKDISCNDTATILYTSGTQGEPKGVVLSHKNILSNAKSSLEILPIHPNSVNLSILPLSHALEKTCGFFIFLFSGANICLLDNMKTLAKTLKETRPTHLIGVPKLYEALHGSIKKKFVKRPLLKKTFELFLKKSLRNLEKEKSIEMRIFNFIANKLFYSKIKKAFGNNLKLLVSGGAALPSHIAEFFSSIGLPIVEGYGLTEASPVVSVNHISWNKLGTVGRPLSGVEVKLASDGEILIKGDNIMKGYYKNKRATQESIDEKGWLYSGDIGSLDRDGFIRIVGRKKELIITKGGKNISPIKIENELSTSPYIKQSVVFGDNQDYLTALIVPEKSDSYSKAPLNIDKYVSDHVAKINKDLSNYEKIRKYKILDREFTIDSGELTPTYKMKRKNIEKNYVSVIKGMYGNKDKIKVH